MLFQMQHQIRAAYISSVIEHCSPLWENSSLYEMSMNGVLSPGNFAFSLCDSNFTPRLNDAISSLQSFYSRHRRFSMNRTVFSFAKQRATGTRALFPQKSQKFLCPAYASARTLARREFAQNRVRPLFSYFFHFFFVSRLLACARLRRNVKFVTFHHCGLRYRSPDENSTSADIGRVF